MTANPSLPDLLTGYVENAVANVLKGFGASLTVLANAAIPTDFDDEGLTSIMGFSADDYSGTLILAATDPFLTATNPSGTASDSSSLADWIGELTNLVIADLKQSLPAS